MINIGLVNSYVGCGKDTFATFMEIEFLKLCRKTNHIRLAKPGYEIAEKYIGSQERVYVKAILEALREAVNEDIWIDHGLGLTKVEDVNVIIDIRQENELEKAVQNGFFPVRLGITKEKSLELQKMRKERYGKEVVLEESFYNLDSEIGAFNFCSEKSVGVLIDNDGDLDELGGKARLLALAIHLYDLCSVLRVVVIKDLSKDDYETFKSHIEKLEEFYLLGIELEGGMLIKRGYDERDDRIQ